MEGAAGEERNAPGLEGARRNVVRRRSGTLVDGQNVAVGPGVERAVAAGEWDIAAQADLFETGHGLEGRVELLREPGARRDVGIRRGRQGDETDPEILRPKAKVLVTQPNETGE